MQGGDETLNIIINLKDEFSKQLEESQSKLEKLQPTFQKMAAVGTAAFAGISFAAYKSIDAYAEVERANRQLEHAVIGVSKGTQEQVEQIKALSNALQEKAGIDADSLNMGAAQLSTFGLQSASVVKLTKSLADFTVNQDGLNASADQYIQSANTIAEALNGQFGILEKSGIRFTELQQQMILTGTESQKVAALQEGLAQNLRETTDTVSGLDVSMAKMNRTSEDIAEGIGKALKPAIDAITKTIQPLLDKFNAWVEKNPKLAKTLILVGLGVSAFVAAVGFLGLILPSIVVGFTALAAATTAVGGALALVTLPISLIIAAITALVLATIYIVRHWEEIKQKALEIWGSIKDFLVGVWDSIKAGAATAWEGIKAFFSAIWDGIKAVFMFQVAIIVGLVTGFFESMGIDIVAVFQKIGEFFTNFWQALKETFTKAIEEIANVWNSMWSAIGDFVGPIWEGIKNGVIAGWNWLIEKFKTFAKPLSEAWAGMWDGLTTGVRVAWESVKEVVRSSINWMIEKVNTLINAINTVAAKGAGVVGFKAPQIPTIPMLANGGIVNKPTLAMIGEAGPEAVVPLSKMGGMGGGINITINYPEFRNVDDESRMRKMLDDYFRPLLINNKIA